MNVIDFTWFDLLDVVENLPATSALYRTLGQFKDGWSIREALDAAKVNALREANWLKRGGKRKHRPDFISIPGMEKKEKKQTRHKADAMTIEEMNRRLGWTTE